MKPRKPQTAQPLSRESLVTGLAKHAKLAPSRTEAAFAFDHVVDERCLRRQPVGERGTSLLCIVEVKDWHAVLLNHHVQ